MIRTVFTGLVMIGALMVTVPWALLVLVSSLFVASVLVFLAWLLVHALLLTWIPSEGLAVFVSLVLLAVCLASGWALTLWAWAEHFGIARLFARTGDSHGSARLATRAERRDLARSDGLLVGRDADSGRLLRYDGPAHLLTLAPTRAGKGVGTVIPNLLLVPRPVLVIDPKGENARVTYEARRRLGPVHVLDPFGVTGLPAAAYNPLARLAPASLDLGEAAGVLSSAQRHTHFLDSPRIAASLAGSDFSFASLRHELASVFLVLPPNRLDAYSRWLRLLVGQALEEIARDAETAQGLPRAAQKAAGALSGPLERSRAPTAPGEALSAPQAATGPLKVPALFLLDEFAALGRLEAVERAMGLMAGFGLQLWPILQDMSQLRALYGTRANTFVANAGVLQCSSVNDYETAKWLSQLMGQTTTHYATTSHRPGDHPSTTHQLTGRDLLTPDEIMRMPAHLQLLRLQGRPMIVAQKIRYYADPEFRGLFSPQSP